VGVRKAVVVGDNDEQQAGRVMYRVGAKQGSSMVLQEGDTSFVKRQIWRRSATAKPNRGRACDIAQVQCHQVMPAETVLKAKAMLRVVGGVRDVI